MKKTSNFFLAFILSGFLFSCGDDTKESSIEVPEIEFKKEGELYLLKLEDTIKKVDIEIADTDYERQTGLMYRKSMEEDQGMLFIYPNEAPRSFYMKNTYIALDIIFYDKDSIAVSFQENAKPLDETSLPSGEPAQFILELNAGKVKEWNIELGDKIDFKPL
ncbi:MAG: DUF192 domain-containing protein [Bacteroidota bacterium]